MFLGLYLNQPVYLLSVLAQNIRNFVLRAPLTVFAIVLKLYCHIDHIFNPFPKQQILEASKVKEFADNTFSLDDNGRTSSKAIENTVGKGEIAHNEQFLLFPQCFQKTYFAGTLKQGLVVQDAVFSHLPLMVQGLSPLEHGKFFNKLAVVVLSKCWLGY